MNSTTDSDSIMSSETHISANVDEVLAPVDIESSTADKPCSIPTAEMESACAEVFTKLTDVLSNLSNNLQRKDHQVEVSDENLKHLSLQADVLLKLCPGSNSSGSSETASQDPTLSDTNFYPSLHSFIRTVIPELESKASENRFLWDELKVLLVHTKNLQHQLSLGRAKIQELSQLVNDVTADSVCIQDTALRQTNQMAMQMNEVMDELHEMKVASNNHVATVQPPSNATSRRPTSNLFNSLRKL